jgi:signal transduction histidine kinase
MLRNEVHISRWFLVASMSVAVFFLSWNVLSVIGGWKGYIQIVGDIVVILVLVLRFRYTRIVVKVWAALPLLSLATFLLLSAMHGAWSRYPLQHVLGAMLTLPLFLTVDRAIRRNGNLTFGSSDRGVTSSLGQGGGR